MYLGKVLKTSCPSLSSWFIWWFQCYINCLFVYLTSFPTFFRTKLLPYLSTSLTIGPIHFQAAGCKRRPNLALVFVFDLCCSIFCYRCMFAWLVAWHRWWTSVCDWGTFPVLRSTCSWWWPLMWVNRPLQGQPTRPTQFFILLRSINEQWAAIRCALPRSGGAIWWMLTE